MCISVARKLAGVPRNLPPGGGLEFELHRVALALAAEVRRLCGTETVAS